VHPSWSTALKDVPDLTPPLHSFTVSPETAGRRLDVFLAERLPTFSRAALQRAIEAGQILVDDAVSKPSLKLRSGNVVAVVQLDVPREGPVPQQIPLDILHEDDAIVVVNKAAGMIVHPAKGHWDGTLAGALAYHFGVMSQRGGPTRPGIVHRLDRDTSGAIVVAKNDQAHDALAAQFKARTVEKRYLAIVIGVPEFDQDIINQPIGDHPTERQKKAIRPGHPSSREAVTHYELVERFRGYALVRARPTTGRTHQIRLHLAHAGYPVLCDRLYAGRNPKRITELELIPREKLGQDRPASEPAEAEPLLARHALHAHRLTLVHPTSGERMEFEAPLAVDMEQTLAALRRWRPA
jgi:23S rRNA pseudouridine1911/1915/1917 synthase